MAVKITSVDEAIEDTGLKILVHGQAGAGKTVLCATTKEPTLILNIEGGLLSLKGAPSYIKTVKIESIANLEEVLIMLQQQRDADDQQYKWVCLDSLSDIAETVLANEMEKSTDPRKTYPAFQAEVVKLVKGYRNLNGYNIVMTAKQMSTKDDFTGITLYSPSMPGNKLGPALPYLFDEVFALRVEKDEEGDDYRVLQTGRDVMFEAKDRSGMLKTFEPPKLYAIHEKIHGKEVEVEYSEVAEEKVEVGDIPDFSKGAEKYEEVENGHNV